MHNAPSVVYPVGRSAWMGHALVVLGLLTLVTALVAAFTMEAARQTWFAPLFVLWLGWCAWAWRQWRRSPAGWLRWQADGRAQPDAVAGLWCWQHDRAAAGIELRSVEPVLDLQARWLLRLGGAATVPRWVCLEATGDPSSWPAMRRALTAARRLG